MFLALEYIINAINISRRPVAALVIVMALGLSPLAAFAAASPPAYTLSNPSMNIPSNPPLLVSGPCSGTTGAWTCTNPCLTPDLTRPTYSNTEACTVFTLTAINNARAAIGEPALVLPSNWYTLTIARQLFVMLDMERVGDGYPPYVGINAALTTTAQTAAAANADPGKAPGFPLGNDAQGHPGMGGSWSKNLSVLYADYYWMYADGWGGTAATTANIACTSATAPGCWGHRDELLGFDPRYNPGVGLGCTTCEVGTGYAVVNGGSSYVDLVELPTGAAPATTFSWASELPFFPEGLPYTPPNPAVTTATLAPSTPPSNPAPVPTVTAARRLFNTGELDVTWSTGTRADRKALLLIYAGSTCALQIRAAVIVLTSVTHGVLKIAQTKYFFPERTYSATVSAVDSNGTPSTSGCFSLGRPDTRAGRSGRLLYRSGAALRNPLGRERVAGSVGAQLGRGVHPGRGRALSGRNLAGNGGRGRHAVLRQPGRTTLR